MLLPTYSMISKRMRNNLRARSRRNRLEVIRYLCNEMNQRRAQNSICKLFGYISQIYESQISTLSVSKLYYLEAQNKKLQQLLEQEKEDKIKITKKFRSQLRELNKMHTNGINN